MTTDAFQNLEPALLWKHFADLVQVPRPSKSEFPAIDHLVNWADSHGWSHQKDKAGNLAVTVPATAGHESAPVVVLQSHVDIVVSNAADRPDGVDAALGRIPVVRADCDANDVCVENPGGDWLWAPYTTLGADNGLGVVSAMAAAQESTHGPLILLFTVDEEEGLTGAKNMDPALLEGATYLMNLDSEDDDIFTVGCAGGLDTEIQWSATITPPQESEQAVSVQVSGLKGGHSGVEIHQARGNANRILSQLLDRLQSVTTVRISSISGGDRRNAIPRSADAVILIPATDLAVLEDVCAKLRTDLASHFVGRDEGIQVQTHEINKNGVGGFSEESSTQLIRLLLSLPDGVAGMCPEISDLVETSNNMALVSTAEASVSIVCSSRSSSEFALLDIGSRIQAIATLAGATAERTNGYPGWKPVFRSKLSEICVRVYQSVFSSDPKVESIHAGLECGAILAKMPQLEAISVGPTIRGNHAPGERCSISSVQRFYPFLCATLEELATPV